MEGWAAGSQAQQRRVRKEITPWEALPQAADLTSTYASHYQKWPMPPRNRAIKPQDERPASAARFDTRSTMQDSFQNWSGRHAGKSCRPQSAYEPKDWMQPISTTHREAFQSWGAPKRGAFRPKQAREPPAATPTGRSTAQDSFQPIMHFVPTKSAQPAEKKLDVTAFEGTTTSRMSYQAWPVQARRGGRKPVENMIMGGDTGPFPNSTYRDMFREISIPSTSKCAVGIQVVGGKFYTMLPRGTRPPASKKVLMTTTTDKQTSLDVVIVQTSDEAMKHGKVVGEFELDGIAPSRAGVPQVEVSFVYSNDNSLRVSAIDVQGQRTRALSVKEKIRLG